MYFEGENPVSFPLIIDSSLPILEKNHYNVFFSVHDPNTQQKNSIVYPFAENKKNMRNLYYFTKGEVNELYWVMDNGVIEGKVVILVRISYQGRGEN